MLADHVSGTDHHGAGFGGNTLVLRQAAQHGAFAHRRAVAQDGARLDAHVGQ